MILWLIRHAKSDWHAGAGTDFERPLNARGERDGPRMARWLAAQPDPASWIWTSDAVRARATADFVAHGFAAAAPEVVTDHRLYLATAASLLDVIRETPHPASAAALVAHNPGITELVNRLAGRAVTDNVPTFGVARLRITGGWEDARFGGAELECLTSPKRLRDQA